MHLMHSKVGDTGQAMNEEHLASVELQMFCCCLGCFNMDQLQEAGDRASSSHRRPSTCPTHRP